MDLNRDLIGDRFQDIYQSLARLDRIRVLSREAFLADQDVRDVACYRLLVARYRFAFMSALRLHRVPEAYAECFAMLGEAGLLAADLSQKLQHMARFRNMLIHVYWDVDYDQVSVDGKSCSKRVCDPRFSAVTDRRGARISIY